MTADTTMESTLIDQDIRPDCPVLLFRLAWLWMQVGKHRQSVQAWQRYEAAMRALPASAKRLEVRSDLAMSAVEALRHDAYQPEAPTDANASLKATVADAAGVLSTYPLDRQDERDWEHLSEIATSLGDHVLARQCIDSRHAVALADPDQATHQAWNEAQMLTKLAHAFATGGDLGRGQALARQAITTLAGAAPGQEVNADDWLDLGYALLPLARDQTRAIEKYACACLDAGTSPERRDEVEGRGVGFGSWSWEVGSRERVDVATYKAERARSAWTSETEGLSIVMLLDLLLQTGERLEAARLAIDCVWTKRRGTEQHACKLALQQLEQPGDEVRFWWALTLACAASEPEPESQPEPDPYSDPELEFPKVLLAGCKPAEFFARYFALARKQLPGHPAADVMEGYRLSLHEDYSRALPLLEKLNQCPDIANHRAVDQLWLTRVQVLGLERGLARGFVESSAGRWSLSMAMCLEGRFKRKYPNALDWPAARLDELITRYYEQGLIRFEAIFNAAKGRPKDFNAHEYSSLCEQLGNRYRLLPEQSGRALELHEKGNAASPSAGNYAGLMWCHHAAGRKEAFVEAADRLWHHASESHWQHEPIEYFPQVCLALLQLERDAEIPFWLQRFVQWGNRDTGHWEAGRIDQYMETLLQLLRMMARKNPDDALAAMTPLLEEIRHSGDEDHIGLAPSVLERARKHKEAIEWYESALVATDPGKEENNEQREAWLHRIAGFEKALRDRNPLWKVQR
ncbi:MAG: hypothetical protein ABI212_14845 [Burkholderiaceae bacterium]